MDPRMNEYDGYHSSYQDGGFGHDQQQEYYMDNQGVYHDQQWNNNYQDPYSSSSQYQEPSSSTTQCQDAETLHLLQQILDGNKVMIERVRKLEEQREEDERVLDVLDEIMESPIDEEIDKEEHLATHEEETRIVEEVAKGGSNESTPNTLEMEKCDLPKVKKSLQALLESDDLGEFHSKFGHLRFILDNKEMLGEVLQEYEEEQSSSFYMRTLFKEAPSMEKEETIRSMDVFQVEHMVKTEMVRHDLPLVVEPREKLKPMKHAKRRRRRKPKGTKGRGIEPKPPLLTFTPFRYIDGKLECKVTSKGRSKPFSKVKILLAPCSKGEDCGTINEAMVKAFGMKLGDRGPLFKSNFPIPPNG